MKTKTGRARALFETRTAPVLVSDVASIVDHLTAEELLLQQRVSGISSREAQQLWGKHFDEIRRLLTVLRGAIKA